jgi:hypothetical protein
MAVSRWRFSAWSDGCPATQPRPEPPQPRSTTPSPGQLVAVQRPRRPPYIFQTPDDQSMLVLGCEHHPVVVGGLAVGRAPRAPGDLERPHRGYVIRSGPSIPLSAPTGRDGGSSCARHPLTCTDGYTQYAEDKAGHLMTQDRRFSTARQAITTSQLAGAQQTTWPRPGPSGGARPAEIDILLARLGASVIRVE